MAIGRLAAQDITPGADRLLYTVPADLTAFCTLNLCNRTANPIPVRVAITTGAVPVAADWIEYDTQLPANSPLERGGIVLQAAGRIYINASAVGVSASVWGYEE